MLPDVRGAQAICRCGGQADQIGRRRAPQREYLQVRYAVDESHLLQAQPWFSGRRTLHWRYGLDRTGPRCPSPGPRSTRILHTSWERRVRASTENRHVPDNRGTARSGIPATVRLP